MFEHGDVESELIADLSHLPFSELTAASPQIAPLGASPQGTSPFGFPHLTPGLLQWNRCQSQPLPSSACSGELQRYSSASAELARENENILRFALHMASPGLDATCSQNESPGRVDRRGSSPSQRASISPCEMATGRDAKRMRGGSPSAHEQGDLSPPTSLPDDKSPIDPNICPVDVFAPPEAILDEVGWIESCLLVLILRGQGNEASLAFCSSGLGSWAMRAISKLPHFGLTHASASAGQQLLDYQERSAV